MMTFIPPPWDSRDRAGRGRGASGLPPSPSLFYRALQSAEAKLGSSNTPCRIARCGFSGSACRHLNVPSHTPQLARGTAPPPLDLGRSHELSAQIAIIGRADAPAIPPPLTVPCAQRTPSLATGLPFNPPPHNGIQTVSHLHSNRISMLSMA